jgi:hypothetical protein
MSVTAAERTTLVIASLDSEATLRPSLRAFLSEVAPGDDIILVDASRDRSADVCERTFSSVRVLRRAPGHLVPELWAAGLRAATTPLVAFSTAQMVPRPGWLDSLRARLESPSVAGVGGSIAPGLSLSRADRALYLLRYANYLPPVPASAQFEPPGDNALYRRDWLEAIEPSWLAGFWEVEVHQDLRKRGADLACAPDAVVEFQGGTDFAEALQHRVAHARRYGHGRTRNKDWPHRLVRSVAFPAVPPLLLARIIRSLRSRGEPVEPWLASIPQLLVFLSAWSMGEAAGACLGPPRRRLDAA